MADATAREVKVVLLGDAGVGKSCLVLRFVTGSFDKFSESTIGEYPCAAQPPCLPDAGARVPARHLLRRLPPAKQADGTADLFPGPSFC